MRARTLVLERALSRQSSSLSLSHTSHNVDYEHVRTRNLVYVMVPRAVRSCVRVVDSLVSPPASHFSDWSAAHILILCFTNDGQHDL